MLTNFSWGKKVWTTWGRFFFLAILILAKSNSVVLAANCEDFVCATIEDDDERAICVDQKISCYQEKIDESKSQQDTLASAIANIDYRVKLQEIQIEKTRLEIVKAKKEVEVLSERIDNLSASMEKLAQLLTKLVASSYKAAHLSDLEMYLESVNFQDALQRKQQEEIVSLQTSKLLFKAMDEKLDFDQKKEDREVLQVALEAKTTQLKNQQAALEQQKAEKTILLSQTKNDEKTYQRLLNDARKESEAFRNFASSAGGSSCLGSSPGEGNNGWFLSQRDPRWCKQYIGGSSLTVGEVGCYLTAVAMVHKRTGVSTSPSIIAANRSYFFSNTALMLTPPAPSGHTYKRYDYFKTDIIDDELKAGRPVIVHVRTNNGWGGHFIVLISGENGSYTMHDPWQGPDLNFSRYYSVNQIDSLRLFTQ